VGRSGGPAKSAGKHFDLGPEERGVAGGVVQQPVEVDRLRGVEVEERDPADADAGEGFGNKRADAPGADDSDVQPGQVSLDL
jgi:hypothetical protein